MKRLAALPLIVLVCSMSFQAPAQALRPVDSDGYVPIRYGCDLSSDWVGRSHRTLKKINGSYTWQAWIELNRCRLSMQRAGPYDIARIIKHERAHAVEGWGHYEGTPEENDAWDPTPIKIVGI